MRGHLFDPHWRTRTAILVEHHGYSFGCANSVSFTGRAMVGRHSGPTRTPSPPRAFEREEAAEMDGSGATTTLPTECRGGAVLRTGVACSPPSRASSRPMLPC